MKGAIEFYTMFLIFMISVILGIQIVSGFVTLQLTHWQTEASVSYIEEYDEYNNVVKNIIEKSKVCKGCKISVFTKDSLLYVKVSNEISIPLIGFKKEISFTSIPNI